MICFTISCRHHSNDGSLISDNTRLSLPAVQTNQAVFCFLFFFFSLASSSVSISSLNDNNSSLEKARMSRPDTDSNVVALIWRWSFLNQRFGRNIIVFSENYLNNERRYRHTAPLVGFFSLLCLWDVSNRLIMCF